MKRIIALLLVTSMAFNFAACGANADDVIADDIAEIAPEEPQIVNNEAPIIIQTETEAPSGEENELPQEDTDVIPNESEVSNNVDDNLAQSNPEPSNTNETSINEASDPLFEIDKNLFTVELTVPADLIGEEVTQESLDAEVTESGIKSATLNADGSVTLVMTKNQHDEMMDELKTSIDEGLAGFVGSAETPSITAIETNNNYTHFKVILSTDTVGFSEAFIAIGFVTWGAMYNVLNGTEIENIYVSYINQATGDVIGATDLLKITSDDDEDQMEPAQANEPEQPVVDDSTLTIGQKNALKSAQSYLSWSSFSYEGLIEQLEWEQYSHEDAVFAADNCGADWYEQALNQALSYLEWSAFSYAGLIEQLEYDHFTSDQAIYATDNCNADWNEQAVKSAKSYLEHSAFSHDGLIEQLEWEGFTHDQAVYGVTANGY